VEDDREKILASIRRGLRGVEKYSAARKSESPLAEHIGRDFPSRFAKFKEELGALGGEAALVATEAELAELLLSRVDRNRSVFIYDDIRAIYKTLTGLWSESREARYEIEFGEGYDKHDAAIFDTAVTGCLACVAETGSVALTTHMRLPAALAKQLIVVARESQLLPSLDELFTDKFSNFRESNLFLITGPSRTADIEKQLVTGVHGPKEILVIFIQH
jgi:L-lactate dehydrogenase complex protein LldG